jgi:3-oxoacyl-[acyl-carrier protein] reductase
MIARRHGRIINMVSGAAGRATPYNTAYACSKAAVVRFTDSLAEEVRHHGIVVFALRPGNVQTDMLSEFVDSASARRWLADEIMRLRPQPPDRAVAATLWLAEGHGDALSGRWVDADDDLENLERHAEDITTQDLQQLRRARLSTLDL